MQQHLGEGWQCHQVHYQVTFALDDNVRNYDIWNDNIWDENIITLGARKVTSNPLWQTDGQTLVFIVIPSETKMLICELKVISFRPETLLPGTYTCWKSSKSYWERDCFAWSTLFTFSPLNKLPKRNWNWIQTFARFGFFSTFLWMQLTKCWRIWLLLLKLTNQRPVSRSRDRSRPIRGQNMTPLFEAAATAVWAPYVATKDVSEELTLLCYNSLAAVKADQSEASIPVTWSLSTNQRLLLQLPDIWEHGETTKM